MNEQEQLDADLLVATKDHRTPDVIRLLKQKAHVDARDKTDGRESTPLMWAAWKGYADIISILLSNGAEVNAADNCGCTSTFFAQTKGFADCLALLTAAGGKSEYTANQTTTDPVSFFLNMPYFCLRLAVFWCFVSCVLHRLKLLVKP